MACPRQGSPYIKDVLRLKLHAKLSHERIAAVLSISKGVVTKYLGLAAAGVRQAAPDKVFLAAPKRLKGRRPQPLVLPREAFTKPPRSAVISMTYPHSCAVHS